MAKCDYCGSMILFGGVRQNQWRFCNAECQQGAALLYSAGQIPEEIVAEAVKSVHQGTCPKCTGPGPVDVHVSRSVWSALVMTRWGSKSAVCCQSCGSRAKLGGAASSMFLGWWGFPWGLIMTPIQVTRNLHGLISSPDPLIPSDQLAKHVRIHLASHSRPPGPSAS